MKKKNTIQSAVCILLILLTLSFIWGNSLLPAKDSSALSGELFRWLKVNLGEYLRGTEYLLRKLAHFSEFAGLGMVLTWFFHLMSQKGIHSFTMPLLFGSMTALLDETFQRFSPGRDPNVIDVWIDTAGVATGSLLLLLIFFLWQKRKHQSSNGGK